MEDRRLFYLLFRAQRKLHKTADRIYFDKLGVTSAQMGAIYFLLNNDGCLLSDLSVGLELNNSAITGLVNRMEKINLIERRRCPMDGRAYRVYLKKKSKALIPKAVPLLEKANRAFTKGFSKKELDVVILFLNTIIKSFEENISDKER